MIKLSKYNRFVKREDGSLLAYNGASGALALMTDENFQTYQRLVQKLETESPPALDEQEQELLKQLEYANFVYDGDYDEIDRLYFIHHAARYDNANVGLVIAPTMACNMACEYCFEENKKGRMDAATIESILEFVERREGQIKSLDVSWYGGEPLLAMDIIEDLSESFIEMGEELGYRYSAYIITNGYLLNRETVDRLAELHVMGAQVTLDGPRDLHDQKRPLKNGSGSYDRIIENLKYASTKMEVTIRMNVDKTTPSSAILSMLDDLEGAGLKQKINVYFGMIESLSSACSNVTDNCFSMHEYSKIETEFFRLILDRGFRVDKLPSPSSNHCMSQSISGFVVDHEGNLYRCFNYVGDKTRAMGKIHDSLDYLNHNFLDLFGFDPFSEQKCRECEILPVCMGGCPARRRDQNLPAEELCASWKHNLPQMLELIALSRQRQMQSAQKEMS